ncbi:MAG: ABC transporter ATP-binding protein [Thermoplasmata archaeon]|nr:ABC transporter ATP-binding protein [Thermoplasmata archaeon]
MLRVRKLYKWYEGSVDAAVNGLSFGARKGEIVGILGTNGAGKTTTLSIMAGLLRPTEGDVTVAGHSVVAEPLKVKELTGYMPENPHLYERLTGREFLRLTRDLRNVPEEEGERFHQQMAEHIELADHLDEYISTYSKGMVQKTAFMAAIGHRPSVLLLDEPLSGIDPVSSRRMRDWLGQYADHGNVILLSTHIVDLAERMCDRIVVLHRGNKVEEGTVADIVGRTGKGSLEDAFIEIIRRTRYGDAPPP